MLCFDRFGDLGQRQGLFACNRYGSVEHRAWQDRWTPARMASQQTHNPVVSPCIDPVVDLLMPNTQRLCNDLGTLPLRQSTHPSRTHAAIPPRMVQRKLFQRHEFFGCQGQGALLVRLILTHT